LAKTRIIFPTSLQVHLPHPLQVPIRPMVLNLSLDDVVTQVSSPRGVLRIAYVFFFRGNFGSKERRMVGELLIVEAI
jgi:hypothetical protein